MSAPGERVVAAARQWLGTPWIHQGRLRGAGVDCVGLLAGVGAELGLEVHDVRAYARAPSRGELRQVLRAHLEPVPIAEARAGDVLLFDYGQAGGEAHVGILTGPDTMIHAYEPAGRVLEHSLDAKWERRISGCFRVPELKGATHG